MSDLVTLGERLRKLADWERDDPYGSGDHQWLREAADALVLQSTARERLEQERDAAIARAVTSERFRAEDAASHLDDQLMHIKRWQAAEASRDVLALKVQELEAKPNAPVVNGPGFVSCLDCGTVCVRGESCPNCGLGD